MNLISNEILMILLSFQILRTNLKQKFYFCGLKKKNINITILTITLN